MEEVLGTPKDRFMEMVRTALGRSQGEPPVPYPPLQEDLATLEKRTAEVMGRLAQKRGELVQELARVAALRGWLVHRASGSEAALDYVRKVVAEASISRVVRSAEDVFQRVAVAGLLESMDVKVRVMAREGSDGGTFEVHDAELGITGVDYAIAETGTAVQLPRRGLSRLVSLFPPVHLALVRASEILESLDDLYLLRRLAYHRGQGDMGSYMAFITGPSRTADIEQTLVIGAHGPRETHMVILEEE
jgi:L-lactate dehydrogenase complex protein LldG